MTKEQIIDKWLPIISDDYMHFTPDQFAYAKLFSMQCNVKDFDDRGVMMWGRILPFEEKTFENVIESVRYMLIKK